MLRVIDVYSLSLMSVLMLCMQLPTLLDQLAEGCTGRHGLRLTLP